MTRLTYRCSNLGKQISRFHFDLNLESRLKNWEYPANVKPANFKILLPPVLKDEISNKRVRNQESGCLEELTIMFSCWKRNDFIQHRCTNENLAYQKCFTAAQEAASIRRSQEAQGIFAATENRYPAKVVNKFLQKFPQPKHKY